MKPIKFFNSLLLFVIAISSVSCVYGYSSGNKQRPAPIKGNGDYVEERREVGAISELKVSGPMDVQFTVSPTSEPIRIYGESNILPIVETNYDNGKLEVKFKDGVTIPGKYEKLIVYLSSPTLTDVMAAMGNVKVIGKITTPDFHTEATALGTISIDSLETGSLSASANAMGNIVFTGAVQAETAGFHADAKGQIEANALICKEVRAFAYSLGGITVRGDAEKSELHASSLGDINARFLISKETHASASSLGSISCYSDESLYSTTKSLGTIRYEGNCTFHQTEASAPGMVKPL